MNRILGLILEKYAENKSSIRYKRTKALSLILFASSILILFLFINNIIKGLFVELVTDIFLLAVLIGAQFIIKSGREKLAGNIISIFITVLVIFAMFVHPVKSVLPYQFYVFFVMIIFSAMFGSRRVLSTVSFLAIISTIILFNVNEAFMTDEMKTISKHGLVVYEVLILIAFTLSFLFTNYINQAISELSENSQLIKAQNQSMKRIVNEVKQSAFDLTNASQQLSSISQEISKRANEQAATTEEISASMEEMLATITSNTEKAENTFSKTEDSSEKLESSRQVIMQTIDLVNKIASETEAISDIAFQTNILSLNASIEAAAAGDAGKGFAVVAKEVRALAERSKAALDKINELSETGKQMSQQAGEALNLSLPEMKTSAERMKDIAIAGKEQEAGANQINNSV